MGNSYFINDFPSRKLLGNTPRLWGNHEQKGGAVKDFGFVTGKRHRQTDRRTKNRLPKSRIKMVIVMVWMAMQGT